MLDIGPAKVSDMTFTLCAWECVDEDTSWETKKSLFTSFLCGQGGFALTCRDGGKFKGTISSMEVNFGPVKIAEVGNLWCDGDYGVAIGLIFEVAKRLDEQEIETFAIYYKPESRTHYRKLYDKIGMRVMQEQPDGSRVYVGAVKSARAALERLYRHGRSR